MPLLIHKDGQQLGPYSLEEARMLVLSGQLDASDWAWPDGATEWVPLKDVPGYTPATSKAPATPAPSAAASTPASTGAATSPVTGAEQELWRGHPAQALNFDVYSFWALVLIVTSIVVVTMVLDESPFWSLVIFGGVALIALINVGMAYFHLRAIEYVVTNQRVRIISGIFSKNIQEIELFRVKDTAANQSFFLRLFGVGTITILSGDTRNPRIVLSGIPQAVELREKLRQEVMTLRQRFGVREVDVM
jgi:membrane protein YdbS with pleckstrin-like domain